MEPALTFSLGTFRRKTKQEKAAKKKKDAAAARRKARKAQDKHIRIQLRRGRSRPPDPQHRILNLEESQWIILPSVPYELQRIAYWSENKPIEIMKAVRRNKNTLLRRTAYKNQRVRNAFSALARRWIYRKFQQGNEEDLVTCEVPANPIILMDWENRRKYVFEPRTIYRDMVSRLQSSISAFFPKAQWPRNPYTNLKMSYGQFIGLVQQLRARGMTHWTIDSLYSTQYCLKKFQKDNYWKLRETILKNLFTSSTNMEGNGLVLDFIGEAFDTNNYEYEENAYKWGMEKVPDHPHLVAWRTLCYKHYRVSNAVPADEETDKIVMQAARLCSSARGFIALYDKVNPPKPVDTESDETPVATLVPDPLDTESDEIPVATLDPDDMAEVLERLALVLVQDDTEEASTVPASPDSVAPE